MLLSQVIEPTPVPLPSPVVHVEKKEKSLRFCVNYSWLKAITKKVAYLLPQMDDE